MLLVNNSFLPQLELLLGSECLKCIHEIIWNSYA